MSELNFREVSESSQVGAFLEAVGKLRAGEILTVFIGEEGNPDRLIDEVRKTSKKWDFQKHRQGDGSWLVHAKLAIKA